MPSELDATTDVVTLAEHADELGIEGAREGVAAHPDFLL